MPRVCMLPPTVQSRAVSEIREAGVMDGWQQVHSFCLLSQLIETASQSDYMQLPARLHSAPVVDFVSS